MADDLQAILAAQLAELDRRDSADVLPEPELKAPLEAVADPRLLKLVESRFRTDLVREHELPRWAGELPFHLDPEVWRTGFLEVNEGGPPLSIREGLREHVPQASLRDLFRPEWRDAPIVMNHLDFELDPGARQAFAAFRQARTREPLPQIERLALSLHSITAARREILDVPWKPFLADDQPRRIAFVGSGASDE